MEVKLPEKMAQYLPEDYYLVMTWGLLQVYDKTDLGLKTMQFRKEPRQAGVNVNSHDWQFKGPWESVHGPGIGIFFVSRKTSMAQFMAFVNAVSGLSLVIPEPLRNLDSNKTRAMMEQKVLFGSRMVHFCHSNNSLQAFLRDVIEEGHQHYFDMVDRHRNGGAGTDNPL